MENANPEPRDTLISLFDNWFDAFVSWSTTHLLDWAVFWQIAGLAAMAVAAYFPARALRPVVERWVGQLSTESRPGRAAGSIPPLLFAIVFLIPVWLATGVLVQLEVAADLLKIVASLLSAWVLIRLSSSFIANRLLANLVFLFAWSVAALNILGLLDETIDALDAIAVPLGGSRLSLLTVLNGVLLFVILLWGALALSGLAQNYVRGHADISPRAQVLLGKVVRFSMIALAAVVALASAGTNLAALAVFTGALGVGIGIGLQTQVSNLLSGLFLLLDKSIKPGDVIEVGDTFGWVKDMHARYVGVVTRDNKELLIPNDDFVTNHVINWSHSDVDVRMEVEFRVSYESDAHQVRRLAVQAAVDADPRIVRSRPPVCHVRAFGESSLNFVLRFWINDPQNGVTNIKGEVLLALWDKFKENSIQIPYPHRHVVLHDSEGRD